MVNETVNHLKSLHTSAIDARNGYREALKDAAGIREAEGKGMMPLFRDMMNLHDANATELGRELVKVNELPDEEGSFMTVIHKTIMDVRSLFEGLDESVLPGLIDGEKRNVSKYEDALKQAGVPPNVAALLKRQRQGLVQKISWMQELAAESQHVS